MYVEGAGGGGGGGGGEKRWMYFYGFQVPCVMYVIMVLSQSVVHGVL